MKSTIKLLLLFIAVFFQQTLFATGPASIAIDLENLSLVEAVNTALENNRSIKRAILNKKAKDGQAIQAHSLRGPKINANLTHTRVDEVARADFAGQSLELGKLNNQRFWLELYQPIFPGKKDKIAIQSARLAQKLAGESISLSKQQIITMTSMSFFSWLYAIEVKEVGKLNLELAQAHFELVQKRYQLQQASKYELLRAEVRLTQTRSSSLKDQNDEELARLELLKIMALPLGTSIRTSQRLEIHEITDLIDPDSAIIEERRTDLKIRKTERELAAKSLAAAKSEKNLTIGIFGQFGSENPSSKSSFGALEQKNYWNAGININLPVIDSGLADGRIIEARSQLQLSANHYEDSLEQAKLEIRKAVVSIQTARQIVVAQKQNMLHAEETLRLAKVRYDNGMFTQVDLFDAENAWSNARLMYLQAVFLHHQARLEYLLATGKAGEQYGVAAND